MHATAGRRQDHLRFALQEAIAPILYPEARDRGGVIRPAVHPAVEALMHQYHAHAKLIRNETERLLQRATARDDKRRKTQPVMALGGSWAQTADAHFVVRDGALEPIDPAIFERKPSEMIRIFQRRHRAWTCRWRCARASCSASWRASRPELLREDAEAGRRFVELLCDKRDRANPSRLEQMQDLGLLAAIMPEWEPSTGRVQHDIYHVYTVDQHALYAVGRLHALPRGDHADGFPVPTETVHEVDTAGRAGDRARCFTTSASRTAARTARSARGWRSTICRRLGIDEEDTQRVEFLVRQHLVMGQMSQRRDLEDLGMISDFARAVRRRREPARAVPADVLRSRVGRARRDVELEGDAARRAVHAHAVVPAPRARPAGLRAGGDRRRAAERRAARLLGEPLPGGGGERRWRTCSRVPEPLLRRERRGTHRGARAPDAGAARAGQELDDRGRRTTRGSG